MSWIVSGVSRAPTFFQIAGTPDAAYSLRQLDLVDKNVVRVRRSSDNSESDFTAAQVSDGSLATWVGAGNNGFVRTWYDQTGNNRNAVQSTDLNQPQIVSSGTLVTENAKPAIDFSVGLGLQITPTALNGAIEYSVFATCNFKSADNFEFLFVQSDGSAFANRVEIGRNSTNNALRFVDGAGAQNNGVAAITNLQRIISATRSSAAGTLYVNGTLDISISSPALPIGNFTSNIGLRNGIFPFRGTIQELSIYRSSQESSRSTLELNINTAYSVY